MESEGMYDISKEGDKGFLKEAFNFLQEEVIKLRMQVAELLKQKQIADDIAKGLSDQLNVLRQKFFNNKQEKMPQPEDKQIGRKSGKNKNKLPHNQSPLSSTEEKDLPITLDEEIIDHILREDKNDSESNIKGEGNDVKEVKGFYECSCGDPICKLKAVAGWYEESSEVDVLKRRYVVNRHRRQKYKGSICGKIVTAPGPDKLIATGEFSVLMGVEVACDKYERHLPLERQIKEMARNGLVVTAKTLFGLTEHVYNKIFEIPHMIRREIFLQPWVHIDESPMNFYNPKKARGYVWSISNNYGAFYQFEPNRNGKVAQELLKGYVGSVMSDGLSVYEWLNTHPDMVHVYCWAHSRSKFFVSKKDYPIANEIVLLIDDLFDIEHEANTFEELKILRDTKSRPKVKEIEEKIDALKNKHLESSSIGKAINYFNCRRARLKLFIDNEKIPLSNNSAEQAQRDPVMGRKNFHCYRSINGADVAMLFYSVFCSCKRIGVDGKTYLLEQTLRAIHKLPLETPYQYGKRLKEKVIESLSSELKSLGQQDK